MRKIIASLVATGLLLGSIGMANAAETNLQKATQATKHKTKATHRGKKANYKLH